MPVFMFLIDELDRASAGVPVIACRYVAAAS